MISVYGHLAVETTQVRLREKTMGHHAQLTWRCLVSGNAVFPFRV